MIYERWRLGGRIRFHAIPGDPPEEMLRDWLRMSFAERERVSVDVYEVENIITQGGKQQFLSMIGNVNSVAPFSQYLGIGTTAIISVGYTDTSVPGEFYRTVLSQFIVVGTQVDCQYSIPSGSGNATYASVGIFGNGASGTLGSGSLMTHALASYTKTSANSLVTDYLLNLQ